MTKKTSSLTNIIMFPNFLKLVYFLPLQPFSHKGHSNLAVWQQILLAVLVFMDKCLALCLGRAHSFHLG